MFKTTKTNDQVRLYLETAKWEMGDLFPGPEAFYPKKQTLPHLHFNMDTLKQCYFHYKKSDNEKTEINSITDAESLPKGIERDQAIALMKFLTTSTDSSDLDDYDKTRKEDSIQYPGILVRASLDDDGQIPRSEALQESPDTIPYGSTLVDDPTTLFTKNYDKNVAMSLVADQKNLIYIRGKNLGDFQQEGTAYLYWALETNLDSPKKWKNNQLLTIKGRGSEELPTAETDEIVVTETPFEWSPDASLAGESIVLIGVAATNEEPNPVPGLGDSINFDRWISKQGGVGAFQTTIDAPPELLPTFSTSAKYALENEAGMVSFAIRTKNIPIGSTISFVSSEPDANGDTIQLQPTKTNNNPFIAVVDAEVSANFTTQIDFTLFLPQEELADADNEVSVEASQIPTEENSIGGPVKPTILAKYATQIQSPTQAS